MAKTKHEVRDGVHGFIEFNNIEKQLIDSMPYQRLRNIHQLAMTYQVYPGATHKRFEHCLGVMEIASRIFDRAFDKRLDDNVQARIADQLEPADKKSYWKSVIRAAALLHDVGHLPFSHAAEAVLLPDGWDHERITADIIRHSEIADILRSGRPQIDPEDVIDVAYSVKDRVKHQPDFVLNPWKTVLNEIITGNTFGADRIDFLLRDSWHAGVAYGRFDPDRLIGALRLAFDPASDEVTWGVDIGGIHAAEALLLARYFMYTQVYFHDVRRVYDVHLQDFLVSWLPGGKFPTDWHELLDITDNEVLTALRKAALNSDDSSHDLATRVMNRKHFRTVFDLVPTHKRVRPSIFNDIEIFATERWGADNVRATAYGPKSESNNFLVLNDDGTSDSSLQASGVIANLPPIDIGQVFVSASLKDEAKREIDVYLHKLLKEAHNGL